MIHAVLIDDERLALMKLGLMLEEFASVAVVATYTDIAEAILSVPQLEPNVIFLDIDMPEINGLQAAERLQGLCPDAHIVFVTAYNNYALEAFELNALDYVLKPVRPDRLLKTIQRLEGLVLKAPKNNPSSAKTMIRMFQSLRFDREGQTYINLRWRTSKGQELFAYLIHNRNRFVSKDTLIDLFWPDFEPKKASTHLYTTIYQVRQSLKQSEIDLQITNVSGREGYTLDTGAILIDVTEWENGIFTLQPIDITNYVEHQRLFDFYWGDYFGNYDYIWAESERQRLRTIWLHHAMGIAEFYIDSDRITEAATVYQRVVQLQPFFEQAHLGLMKIYDKIGERSAVEEQYRILTELLTRELNIQLPAHIESWYEQWRLDNLRHL